MSDGSTPAPPPLPPPAHPASEAPSPAPPSPPPPPPSAPLAKPPRPAVRAAALLVIVGALVSAVAVNLPWLSVDGDTRTGTGVFVTTDFELYDRPGDSVLVISAVLLGLGIALFFAGRVLAVAIIAIVFAAIGLIVAIAMIGIVDDTRELVGRGSLGVGLIALVPGAALAVGGAIWATATRRRW